MGRKRIKFIYFSVVTLLIIGTVFSFLKRDTEQNQSSNIDEFAVNDGELNSEEDDHSEASDEQPTEDNHNHDNEINVSEQEKVEATGLGFVATFFSFDDISVESSKRYVSSDLVSRLEDDKQDEAIHISDVKLTKSEEKDGQYHLQFQFKRTLQEQEAIVKQTSCSLFLNKKDGEWIVTNYTWSEE